MPDHFAKHLANRNRAKGAAVDAVVAQANHPQRLPTLQHPFHQFNQAAHGGVLKNHGISHAHLPQQNGDFGYDHKIPFPVDGLQTVFGDFQNLKNQSEYQ